MPFVFTRLDIHDLIMIVPKIFPDDRGYFLETYKRSEFVSNGIKAEFVQDNHSFSSRGVLRGLHFQLPPNSQGKLVSVINGRIWDVAVDLRVSSSTFGKWVGVELSDENKAMLWIPEGFAHGFVTLSNTVHLIYKCTAEYCRASERGIRWDDPAISIKWPVNDVLVSTTDQALPEVRNADSYFA